MERHKKIPPDVALKRIDDVLRNVTYTKPEAERSISMEERDTSSADDVIKRISDILSGSRSETGAGIREEGSDKETRFCVDLYGLKLPEEVAKRIEGKIRQVVMAELADTDLMGDRSEVGLDGDLLIKPVTKLPTGYLGMIINYVLSR